MTESDQQNIVTFLIATTAFTLLYLHLHTVWLVFLAFGVLGLIALVKEGDNMEQQHKLRYRIFIAALAASSLIGMAWQALSP